MLLALGNMVYFCLSTSPSFVQATAPFVQATRPAPTPTPTPTPTPRMHDAHSQAPEPLPGPDP